MACCCLNNNSTAKFLALLQLFESFLGLLGSIGLQALVFWYIYENDVYYPEVWFYFEAIVFLNLVLYGSLIGIVSNSCLFNGIKKRELTLISPWFVTKTIEIIFTVLIGIAILVIYRSYYMGYYIYAIPSWTVLKFLIDVYSWSVVKSVYMDIKFNRHSN